MIKKIQDNLWDYILIYILLITKAGFLFYEQYSAATSILFLALLFFTSISRHSNYNPNHIIVIFILFICYNITCIFKGIPEISKYMLFQVNLVTALLIVTTINFKDFSKCFSNIIYIICIFSSIGQILIMLGFPIYDYLPTLTNSKGFSVGFFVFAEFWKIPIDGVYRATGIFWEPGAFQAMIVIAFLLDSYVNKPKKYKYRYLFYIAAVCLTYSTTGIICLVLCIFLAYFQRHKLSLPILFGVCIMAIALVTLIIYLLNNVQGFLYYSLFGKLEMLNNAYVYGENNSALSRWESVIVPLEFLVRSPILGIGEEGLEEMTNVIGHNMFTCTIVNYFAYYGFLCGVVCINGFIKLMDLRRKSFIEAFFLISIMIITTISENFAYNPIFTCFILYGYLSNKQRLSTTIDISKHRIR